VKEIQPLAYRSCDDPHYTFSYELVLSEHNELPSFIKFDRKEMKINITATKESEEGTYTLVLIGTLNDSVNSKKEI